MRLLLTFCALTNPALSFGQAWVLTPQVDLRQQYDDNFRLTSQSKDQVFATQLTGLLSLSRLTEALAMEGRAQLEFIKYSGDTQNLKDQNNQLIDFSTLYKTSLDQWGLDGSYKRDSLLRTIALEDDIDPNDIDILLVRRSVRRQRFIVNPTWQRATTERTEIGLEYNFNGTNYEQVQVEGLDLVDYREHTFRGNFFYDLTERYRLNASTGAVFYRAPDDDSQSDTYALGGGIDVRFSETLRGGLNLGLRYTSFETATEKGDDSGYLFRLYGSRETPSTRWDTALERTLIPSGVGQLLDTYQFTLRMNKELSPRLRFLIGARAFYTNETSQNDRRFASIEPRLRWNLTRWWTLNTSYRFRWEKRDNEPDSAQSNAVFISLTYLWPESL